MIITIITSLMLTALSEYVLHKYYLHNKSGHDHVKNHHKIFQGNKSFSNPDSNPKDILSSMTYNFITTIPVLLYAALVYINTGFYQSILVCILGILYVFWVEYSHYLYHKPSGKTIEKNKLFLLLKEHHRDHHAKYSYNYGIGSNLWDIILNTKFKKNKTPQ